MNWLVTIVTGLLTWFGEALWRRAEKPTTGTVVDPSNEDEKAHKELLEKLRKWGGITLCVFLLTGCFGDRVYFARPAVPVRLGQDVKGVTVFIKTGPEQWTKATANLFAGQTVLTDPNDFPLPEVLKGQNVKPVSP